MTRKYNKREVKIINIRDEFCCVASSSSFNLPNLSRVLDLVSKNNSESEITKYQILKMSLEPKLVLNYPSTSAEAAVNSPAI